MSLTLRKLGLVSKKVAGRIALGAAAGGLATRHIASGLQADEYTSSGIKTGAMVGVGSLIAPKLAKSKTVRAAVGAAAKVIFRRIGGRVIPIKSH